MKGNAKTALKVALLVAAIGGLFIALREPRHLLTLERPTKLVPRLLFSLTRYPGGVSFRDMAICVKDVNFSPDGRRLVTSGPDERLWVELKVWDASTGQKQLTVKETSRYGVTVAFSTDGKYLVGPSWGRTVKMWDANSGQELMTFQGHVGEVLSVAVCQDGKRVASVAAGVTISNLPPATKLWDVASGLETLTLKDTNVQSVAFSPDGKHLASVGYSSSDITLWDTTTGQEVLTLKGHTATPRSVEFSKDGKRMASVGLNFDSPTEVKLWDVASGKTLPLSLKGDVGRSTCMALSPDGNRIAFECRSDIKVWDVASGEAVLTLKGYRGGVGCLRFSPDGTRLVSVALVGKAVDLWDVTTRTGGK